MQTASYYIGVDVGSSSARAAVVDKEGYMVAMHTHPIEINKPLPDYYEQSSEDIWNACCIAVSRAVPASGVQPDRIKGMGFDATCSLVALDHDFKPIGISPNGDAKWNVIMWMDHRAEKEADEISATGHPVLKQTGGKMTPEMSAAKLLWLQRNSSTTFSRYVNVMELPDFLTLRATGHPARCLNSLACKWTYNPEATGFSDPFWRQIGMSDVVEQRYGPFIGQERILAPGEPVGDGLTDNAAKELGLDGGKGLKVGAAIIDAYAGAIGTIGAALTPTTEPTRDSVQNRMAVICGTSSCHIAFSSKEILVPGVWGPYSGVVLDGMYTAEGGQSITGALLHHLITTHPAYESLSQSPSAFVQLNNIITTLTKPLPFPALLTKDIHLTPDFHGNRSPLADASLRGTLVGCTLDTSVEALAKLYYSAILALCYGTRQIIEALKAKGYTIDTLFLSGGMIQNNLFLQSLADCTGCRVVIPRENDAVLIGAAALGAAASEWDGSALWRNMVKMGKVGKCVAPCGGAEKEFHERKYRVFGQLYDMQRAIKCVMEGK